MKKRNYIYMLLSLIGATAFSLVLYRMGIDKENVLMVLMIGVLLVSSFTEGYTLGVIASFVSAMLFNYFFAEPRYTFNITSSNDMVLILFFLIASVIASSLTAKFQRQLKISQKNEQTARLLYEVAQSFLNVTGQSNIIRRGISYIKEHTGFISTVDLISDASTYVVDNFQPENYCKIKVQPIVGHQREIGTLTLYSEDKTSLSLEEEWLVNTVFAQIGIALDREFLYNEREQIRVDIEREHVKSSLLRSIGHDLRTPLTGIVGASAYVREKSSTLDRNDIRQLAADIHEQAVWLGDLVENILNMTRIDDGKLVINKQMEVIDDIVNEAVAHVSGLSGRPFGMVLPPEVIAIPMDGKMIVQVLVNLLNNSVNHTPKDCSIELSVTQKGEFIEFSVADGGDGIDPALKDKLFEAFVTSGKTGADGKKGIGLGLSICKVVIEAHGGAITTGTSRFGGALFTFTLPHGEGK